MAETALELLHRLTAGLAGRASPGVGPESGRTVPSARPPSGAAATAAAAAAAAATAAVPCYLGSALLAAARGGHAPVVELLLRAGADPNAPACSCGDNGCCGRAVAAWAAGLACCTAGPACRCSRAIMEAAHRCVRPCVHTLRAVKGANRTSNDVKRACHMLKLFCGLQSCAFRA